MAIPEGYKALAKIGISYKGDYVSGTTYKYLDAIAYQGSTYLAMIDGPVGAPTDDGVNWKYLAKGFPADINDVALTFTEATTRENIESGETNKTIMGKVKKWFADLTAAAFAQMLSSYSDMMANTVSGYLPDAQAVKEGFEEVNSNLAVVGKIYSCNNSASVTLNTTSSVEICSMTVPPGVYLVIGKVGYNPTELTSVQVAYEHSVGNSSLIYEPCISVKNTALMKVMNCTLETKLSLKAAGTGSITSDARINYLQAVRLK